MRLPLKETLIAGSCVAILCTLGTWQVQRLQWKNDITAKLQAQYAQGGKTLRADDLGTIEAGSFKYGTVNGQPLKDKAVLLGPRILEGRSGYHLLLPVEMADGNVLIVNTGWVGSLWSDTLEDRLGTLPATITARGIVRHPDWSSFASKNSPANDLWFRADVAEIATARDIESIYPVILYADKIEPELADVTIHEEQWLPRNKHLQYALFWYALAVVMAGVYGTYIFSRKQDA